MPKHILIDPTSHDHNGGAGQPTGAYLPELAHPDANPASAAGVAEAMVEVLARADRPRVTGGLAALGALLLVLTTACGDGSDATTDADSITDGATTETATTEAGATTEDPTTEDPTTSGSTGAGSTTDSSTGTASTGGEPDAPVVIPGFDLPESAFWSADDQAWFVSNIGTEPGVKDGNGFISRLDADGVVTEMQWLTGLDGPAGLRGAAGKLYVADIDRLHRVDIATASIDETVTIDGAMFLNDVAVGPGGEVFVSDTVTNSVHAWTPGQAPTLVIQTPDLQAPNGLAFKDDLLHVAGIGSLSDPAVVGLLQRIDMGTATPVSAHAAKFDGVEIDGGDFLVTEFTGKLQRISADGATVTLIRDFVAEDGLMSTADFGLDPERGLVVIPDLLGGSVAVYTLPAG